MSRGSEIISSFMHLILNKLAKHREKMKISNTNKNQNQVIPIRITCTYGSKKIILNPSISKNFQIVKDWVQIGRSGISMEPKIWKDHFESKSAVTWRTTLNNSGLIPGNSPIPKKLKIQAH